MVETRTTQLGHGLAKILGIKLVQQQHELRHDAVTRGESVASKCARPDAPADAS